MAANRENTAQEARRFAAQNLPTLLGLCAILLWSSTIGFSRSLSEALGPFSTGAAIYLLAGALASVRALRQYKGWRPIFALPRAYLFGCGALFVVYIVCLYLAVGLAVDHQAVVVVGLINYLWPALTLVFSIPILGHRGSRALPLGILLALAGIALALGGVTFNVQSLAANAAAYLLMLIGAVCWGLYTNLSRRWLGENRVSGVALFLLAGGLALGALRLSVQEHSQWSGASLLQLAYMATGPAWLAYTFWDFGVRRGQIILLSALSYFTPLLSTIISIVVLKASFSPNLWLAALLVIAGAAICQRGVTQEVSAPAED